MKWDFMRMGIYAFSKGKYVLKILDWFNSRKNREVSVYREFLEEIITDNILPNEAFKEYKN